MPNAKKGDKVKVHYTGKLENGDVFDTSKGKEPLEFTIGQNQVLKKFEDSVEGMQIGETANIHIPAEEAYGTKQNDLIVKIPSDRIPDTVNPEPGMKLQMQTQEGQTVVVTVVQIGDNEITLDANHELADKNLNFDIELIDILRA